MSHWVLVKVYVVDDVGPLVTPVSDDTLLSELGTAHLLPAVGIGCIVLELIAPLQAAGGRHELENVVDGQGDAVL